ncbi:MAG: hypothetical protein LC754_19085 [Acidobacteria bacterium]|nr:hypothetical protein [Acidobacteriota bacterium]
MPIFKRVSLFLMLLAIVVVTALAALNKQDKNNISLGTKDKLEQRLSKLPITDYETIESPNIDERAKRRAKSKKYDNAPGRKIDPTYNFIHLATHNDWELGLDSPLPVLQSSAVLIGNVIGAQAFMSNDKNNTYSEFTIRVEKILKNDKGTPIPPSGLIVIERLGGRVRTPTGHIQSYSISGQGTPEVGLRYVFFLGYNPRETGFSKSIEPHEMSRNILTAYELKLGKVFPLDYAGGRNFKVHAGADEATFLNEIQHSIAESLR